HLKTTGVAKLADLSTGYNRKMKWDKIKGKITAGVQKDGKSYIAYKAKKYEDLSKDFFPNFVADLTKEGLLFDAGHSMRTVYWDGSKVVTVGEEAKKACYISTAAVHALGLPDDGPELNALRRFRDHVLLPTEPGRRAVAEYYEIAPRVVA